MPTPATPLCLTPYYVRCPRAAEETPERAAVAQRVWPSVVRHVLALYHRGQVAFREEFHGEKGAGRTRTQHRV